MLAAWLWTPLWLLAGCAPMVRLQRALSPETFATPERPLGEHATVVVESGWEHEPPAQYVPELVFERGGVRWMGPVSITDRGAIEIHPRGPGVSIGLYARHVGLETFDFHRIVARSGTIPGEMPTTLRFEPTGPLPGPYRIEMHDLHSVYSDSPVRDGDLVMVEVHAPGQEPERYLFRSLEFGLRTRAGAGLLFRVPFPWEESEGANELAPALTASLAVGYRPRTQHGALLFVGEQLALVGSVGIGSTVLAGSTSIDEQIRGAFNEVLVGGGVDLFKIFTVQSLGNAASLFSDDARSDWALAFGLDAVQLGRFTKDIGARLLADRPLREDRQKRQRGKR